MKKYYEINEEMANRAKQMYSFDEYVKNSETESYQKVVDEIYEIGQQSKERTSEDRHEYVNYLCDKFAKKYAEYINKGFSIELQCPSVMICGGSNFPTKKKEKQNAARNNHMKYYNEKILTIIEKLKSLGKGIEIIKASDPLALEMLQDKIDELSEKQSEMKRMNAYYRKHQTMVGYEDMPEEQAKNLDDTIGGWKQPFAPFELTSINTKIKNAKARINELNAVKEKGTIENENKYFKVIENADIMRLQLIFPDKPDDEIRKILKSNGFKWSPRYTAWQRQLTTNAKISLKKVVISIEKIKG